MSFTKDDLKDGMVCTVRDGDIYAYLGGVLTSLHSNIEDMTEYTDTLTAPNYTDTDIMKITYGGKTGFEREEWRELTIDEAFELLKKGPVLGQGYTTEDKKWAAFKLRSLSPWAECGYHGVLGNYRKFRIKK